MPFSGRLGLLRHRLEVILALEAAADGRARAALCITMIYELLSAP